MDQALDRASGQDVLMQGNVGMRLAQLDASLAFVTVDL